MIFKNYDFYFKNCLLWNPDNGTWNIFTELALRRSAHTSWTPDPRSGITYLMGGYYSPTKTELVYHDGTISIDLEFDLKYELRFYFEFLTIIFLYFFVK